MTAQEFKIAFTKAMLTWYEGAEVGTDPRGEWEYSFCGYMWRTTPGDAAIPTFNSEATYRWKQPNKRTVPIEGVELVAPEVEAPADGTAFYTENGNCIACVYLWKANDWSIEALKNGKVFLTREDCQAMADANRKQRMGGAS